MKKLVSVLLALIMLVTPLTAGAVSAYAQEADPSCIKILLVGNSYTYYNTLDQILCKMGNAAGKDLLVVSAYKSGSNAYELLEEKVNYFAWYQGEMFKSGTTYLEKVAKSDFGSVGRAGEWDYVVLQNNDVAESTGMGDVYMLGFFSPMLKSNRDFIINSNYWVYSLERDRYKEHLAVCKAAGCSIIDTRGIFSQYHNVFNNRVWFKDLTIRDSRNHPSVLGSYVFALSIYAKIFGTDGLAESADDAAVLPFYNSDGALINEIIDTSYFKNEYTLEESIDKTTAAKLQSLVKNYTPYYIGDALVSDGKTLPEGEIDEAVRYYDENGDSAEGWVSLGDYVYYLNNGYIVTDGFKNIDGETYYFDEGGERYSGWKSISGSRYYFYEDGSIAKGFVSLSSDDGTFKTFYFTSKGVMLTGTQVIDGKTYLFSSGAAKQKGEMYQSEWWIYTNSKGETVKKYFNSKGVMATGKKTVDDKEYIFSDSGALLSKTLVTLGKKTYFVNKNGIVQKSKFVSVDGNRYYFNKNGVMLKKRFITSGKNKYYADKTGALRKGWVTIKGKTYYFSKKNTKKFKKFAMVTGKIKIDGTKYRFTKSGVLKPTKKTV